VTIILKSESLTLLEPSGPVQVFSRIALPSYSELMALFGMHLAAQMKAESNICKDDFFLGSGAFCSGR